MLCCVCVCAFLSTVLAAATRRTPFSLADEPSFGIRYVKGWPLGTPSFDSFNTSNDYQKCLLIRSRCLLPPFALYAYTYMRAASYLLLWALYQCSAGLFPFLFLFLRKWRRATYTPSRGPESARRLDWRGDLPTFGPALRWWLPRGALSNGSDLDWTYFALLNVD